MIQKQEFLEYADVFGDFKGTSKSWVEDKLKNDWNVILELDWQGAKQVKEIYPNAETIFILPPSYAELQLRLNARGLDKKEEIKKRLGEAKKEVKNGQHFDHLVVNDEFETALSDLKSIIFANKTLPKERKNFAKVCLEALLED